MIAEFRIGPKIAAAATLGDRTLRMPRKPLPCMIQVQDVIAA